MPEPLVVERSNQFKRDWKLAIKRGKNITKIKNIILMLINQQTLPLNLRDHALFGDHVGSRECHIEPDWLLIYTDIKGILRLERTGTHADLFR